MVCWYHSVRSDAEFLAVLDLARGNVLQELDVKTRIIAVVGGVPVPPAPGAHRGQRGKADIPIRDPRNPAFARVDAERGVDVGQSVIHIGAWGLVADPSRERGILLRGGLQRRADAPK
jgi:hypothetical protein